MKIIIINMILISYVIASNEELLDYVSDDLYAGTYKYYDLMYDGIIKIQLISETGDADIYASQITAKPNYEPDHYCIQSTTCGEDIIEIPQSFKRPVTIGIYGHPSHEISRYTLLIYKVSVISEDTSYNQESEDTYKDWNKKKKKTSFVVALLLSFVNLLFEILF